MHSKSCTLDLYQSSSSCAEPAAHFTQAASFHHRDGQRRKKKGSARSSTSLIKLRGYATCLPDTSTLDQRRESSRIFLFCVIRRLALPLKKCKTGEFFKIQRSKCQRVPEPDAGRSERDKGKDGRSFYKHHSELRCCISARLAYRRRSGERERSKPGNHRHSVELISVECQSRVRFDCGPSRPYVV